MQYLAIVPILAFLIIIHELGHFFAARSVGVTVEEFGIGLPPRAKGWRRNGVLWSLNWLPIGGFVRVKGEDANDRDPGSMQVAGPWQRGWFLIAGPLMNLAAAVVISIILVTTTGVQVERPFISTVEPESPAMTAGWQPGDRIVSIDGKDIVTTQEAIDIVNGSRGDEIIVVVQRGSETVETKLTPRENPPQGQGATGITFGDGRFSDVQVQDVRPHTPAADAGLQPGDKILAINDIEIEAMAQAVGIMDASIGEEVAITYDRGGQESTTKLTVPEASLPVMDVASGSPAAKAELYATDEITTLNGEPITSGQAFLSTIIASSGEPVEIGFVRTTSDGPVDLTTTLQVPNVNELERGQVLSNLGLSMLQPSGFQGIGIEPIGHVSYESVPLSDIIPEGWNQFTFIITGTVDALQTVFTGGAALDSFVGPIGMGQMTGELLDAADGNVVPILLNLTMLISISLGLFNLLPIPALDGGRLVFVALEILRGGKRIPPEKEGAVHMVGMLILLGLIFVIAFMDIGRLVDGESIFR